MMNFAVRQLLLKILGLVEIFLYWEKRQLQNVIRFYLQF